MKRLIFRLALNPDNNGQLRELLVHARERHYALLLCEKAEELLLSEAPSVDNVICPRFPMIKEECLRRADALITNDPDEAKVAKQYGLPTYPLKKSTTPAQMDKWLRNLSSRSVRKAKPTISKPLRCCLISNELFLAQTLGLIANLHRLHQGPIEIHLLYLEDEIPDCLQNPSTHLYRLEDLWTPSQCETIRKRSVSQQAYSSKALLCLKALKHGRTPLFYFDSDLFFLRSPLHLTEFLKTKNILLFPHWNDIYTHTRMHGLFNAGMLGLAPGSEPFLKWWSEVCYLNCSQEEGFFDDQGYLDLAAVQFDGIEIYRGFDEDVAPWNLETLKTEIDDKGRVVQSQGKEIGSYHAVGSDKLGLFELKTCWDQVNWFFLKERPSENIGLSKAVWAQQRSYRRQLEGPLMSLCRKWVRKLRAQKSNREYEKQLEDRARWVELQRRLLSDFGL